MPTNFHDQQYNVKLIIILFFEVGEELFMIKIWAFPPRFNCMLGLSLGLGAVTPKHDTRVHPCPGILTCELDAQEEGPYIYL